MNENTQALAVAEKAARIQKYVTDIVGYPLVNHCQFLGHALQDYEAFITCNCYSWQSEKLTEKATTLMTSLSNFLGHPSATQYIILNRAMLDYQDFWQCCMEASRKEKV